MKVIHVTIKNFMPYYGEVPVTLQPDSESPLVLMGGKNDRGKTAFFTALKFCLYGFEGSPAEIAEKRRHAINRRAAVEGRDETSVTIEFTHNETIYEINRVVEFDQVDDPDEREPNACYVTVTKPGISEDKEDVIERGDPNRKYNEFMNGILPESASDFFFFDGEQLDRYAGSYEETDADVREAIETVLGIKEIQNAVDDLDEWGYQYYQDKWEEKTEDVEELDDLSDRISEKESEIRAKQTEKDSEERELDQKELRLEQLEDEIADAKGVADARQRIKDIEVKIEGDEGDAGDDGLGSELEELRGDQRELHTRLGPLIIGVGAQTVMDEYDVSLVGGLEEVIEYLLDAETCVCGHEISDHEQEVLERNLSKVQDDEMSTVLDLQELADTHLDCLIRGSDPPEDLGVREAERKYVSLQGEIERIESDIEALKVEKEELEEEIEDATIDEDEAQALKEERDRVVESIGRLKESIKQLEDDIDELEADKEELEGELEGMDAASEEEKRYRKLMQLSDQCQEAWQNIKTKYMEAQRESVQEYASEIFLELTNKDDVYEGLIISEDYELDVQTVSGQRDIEEQKPSKGARQIIAYSFIAGLNQYTAREAPVVIDTPIGRLDPEHKDNLIHHLPNFRDQVVILYQPGELDERDVEKMEEYISHHFEIRQRDDDPESSVIESVESLTDLQRVLAQ